jgi:glycosyltransferase involved in cell wall biosynthesis
LFELDPRRVDTDMISVCFTTYNRTDLLYQAVEPFINDERVKEIVISDDASNENIYAEIKAKYLTTSKVKIFRNESNIDCYYNKRQAVKHATSEWVALLDSDNTFDSSFIDVIFSQKPWKHSFAYAPEFARPHFNFTDLRGVAISRNNVSSCLPVGSCETMLNAMNYFVNRDEYLRVWDKSADPVTSDSLFQNYNWLKAGNSIYVTPGLVYYHLVHGGSHYQNNHRRTPSGFHESIVNKLKEMK